jgi:septal ring factor EnvC (AmiA/AmiB activator)
LAVTDDSSERTDFSGLGGSVDDGALEEVLTRVEALSTQLDDLREQLREERSRRQDLEDELGACGERIDGLEDAVTRLDARTDLLEIVESADEMGARQRSATLVQHLHRAAMARERRGEPPAAAVNRDEAEEALHYPDVERTTIYRDMERAARLVGDEDVLAYTSGELRLDLAAGTLPTRFTFDGGGGEL